MKSILLLGMIATTACAGENLLVNGDFTDANPLEGWRTAFPFNEWYAKNHEYVRVEKDPVEGKPAVVIDLPPGVAGMQGGKIESAFYPATKGARYRMSVECMTWDFSAKVYAEAWVRDPKPDVVAKSDVRVPAMDGHPALLKCYRLQLPDPRGRSKQWSRVERDSKPLAPMESSFKEPGAEEFTVKLLEPEWISVKVVVYESTRGAGKSWFRNFRLEKID